MPTEYLPPRGMRDIVGVEAELYEYLFSEFKRIARNRGFKPIITPTVEYFKLFEAKSGEEIRNSMYVFEDKAGRLLVLRPEVTASVVRVYLKSLRALPKPIRLYYIAQCFRYEEPQFARYREFWQGGLEVIGDPDVNADLSAALTASEFLDSIGVKHFYVVGNVLVYRNIMRSFNIDEQAQDRILHLIDKEKVESAINEIKLRSGEEAADIIYKIISAKSIEEVEEYLHELKSSLGSLYETTLQEHSRTRGFIEALRELGYQVVFSPKLVRGLPYYSGLIFEYKVANKSLEVSIGGGGRYDGLSVVYEGPFEYFTGLALGLDRVALALSSTFQPRRVKRVVVVLLRDVPVAIGYKVLKSMPPSLESSVYRTRSLSKGLEYANKVECDFVVIIGRAEYEQGKVLVKNMKTGEQIILNTNSLSEYLQTRVHTS
jgi:histidyl-tRNA synthetase